MDFTFLLEVKDKLPEYTHKYVDSIVSELSEVQKDFSGKGREYLSNKDFIADLMMACSWSSGKASFYRLKKALVEAYNEMYKRGFVTDDALSYVSNLSFESFSSRIEIDGYFFRDIDSAINFVEFVGSRYGCQVEDMSNISSVVVLAWHGFSAEDIVNAKASDFTAGQIVIHPSYYGSKDVVISGKSASVLKLWANANEYFAFPTHKPQNLVWSEYLMRSARSEKLTPNNLFCLIRRFNSECTQYGKKLSLNNLRKNGLFCKMRDSGFSSSPSKEIQRLIGSDKQVAFGYAHQYNAFIDYFKRG